MVKGKTKLEVGKRLLFIHRQEGAEDVLSIVASAVDKLSFKLKLGYRTFVVMVPNSISLLVRTGNRRVEARLRA